MTVDDIHSLAIWMTLALAEGDMDEAEDIAREQREAMPSGTSTGMPR